MKSLLIFLGLNLFGHIGFCQSLEGEWNGVFTYAFTDRNLPYYTFQKDDTPIKITFKLNTDSSYSVYSYSNGPNSHGRDTVYQCSVFYKRISPDSVYLEEMRLIKPDNVPGDCKQKMYLKLDKRKRGLTLEGTWKTNQETCATNGAIRLYRKNP